MTVKFKWNDWLNALAKPEVSPELQQLLDQHQSAIPVIWLLGKTGAGKSSVIRYLTRDDQAVIGSGYEPCTSTTAEFLFPKQSPVVKFMDSRGLGEAGYEPSEDLEKILESTHALLVLTRTDDPEQSSLVKALQTISKSERFPTLHLHTHYRRLNEPDRSRAVSYNSQAVHSALGFEPQSIFLDLPKSTDNAFGLESLRCGLIELLPELSTSFSKHHNARTEDNIFQIHRKEVLGFASAAAATDVLPAVGLIAVPSIQGKMMHSLAVRYDQEWNKQSATAFISLLGSSFLYRYVLSLAGRQLSKFIPVYGQTLGAATAATMSFASTYAIGRVLCLYLYRRKYNYPIEQEELRQAFTKAFTESLKK